jgi:hypothetical protein
MGARNSDSPILVDRITVKRLSVPSPVLTMLYYGGCKVQHPDIPSAVLAFALEDAELNAMRAVRENPLLHGLV